MSDDTEVLEFVQPKSHAKSGMGRGAKEHDAEEDFCPAFGFLRGIRERALALEFRPRNGTREWFPYSWLGPWRFNPSAGLLLKFTGDVVTLVLIRGSNLNALVGNGAINLTDSGIQRHRVLWIREMHDDELRKATADEPIIAAIEIADFESNSETTDWLQRRAPLFTRERH